MAAVLYGVSTASALDIQFDYSFDANNFFVGHLDRQAVLEAAAQAFESRLTDVLTGITPGGSNTWTATFPNPSTGAITSQINPIIPADVVRVYAGARDLPGSTVGFGGPGGYSVSGTQQFVDSVSFRGQAGAKLNPPTDFGPWGGAVSFNIDTTWYFDPDVTTVESIGNLTDFYSIAVHELGHLLGIGTAESWDTHVAGLLYTGPASMAEYKIPVPLSLDLAHWAEGTQSRVLTPVFRASQEAAFDPTLTGGTRKYLTELDYAGLADVGWNVVPEPGVPSLLSAGSVLMGMRRRRKGLGPHVLEPRPLLCC